MEGAKTAGNTSPHGQGTDSQSAWIPSYPSARSENSRRGWCAPAARVLANEAAQCISHDLVPKTTADHPHAGCHVFRYEFRELVNPGDVLIRAVVAAADDNGVDALCLVQRQKAARVALEFEPNVARLLQQRLPPLGHATVRKRNALRLRQCRKRLELQTGDHRALQIQ